MEQVAQANSRTLPEKADRVNLGQHEGNVSRRSTETAHREVA
jgi:hypothetical protein